MPVIQNFQSFMTDGGLVCPPDKKKIEYGLADAPGLFVECRASVKSEPTWCLRLKNAKGTNVYKRLGSIKAISLTHARKIARQVRVEHESLIKAEVAVAAVAVKPAMLLSEFVEQLYAPHARIHKRSFGKDASLYRLRLGPKFGHLPLAEISRLDVQKFSLVLHAEGLSPATVNHHVILLRRYLSLAVSWDLILRKVLKGIELMPVNNLRDTYMTPQETSRLVQVLTTDANTSVCAILLFLLNTGARKMEAIKAKWTDVDLANRLWHVPAENSKSKRPKTLPLNDGALEVLTKLESKGKSTYVFPNPETDLPYTTIIRVWYRLRTKAGLSSKMRIHDMRACLAERLLSAGGSIFTLSRLLGHQDVRTTVTAYARLSAKSLLDAANVGSVSMPKLEPQPA